MEEQRQASEPITYVGGLGNQPRSHVWPYVALGVLPVLLALAVVVFWGPLRQLGGTAGKTVAPYSLALSDISWSTDDLIATVPVDLVVRVANTDQRTVNGVTVRFTSIDPSWQILGATSPNAHGEISGSSVFFPNQIRPSSSLRMLITMRAADPTNNNIRVSIYADHDTQPARVDLLDGRVLTAFSIVGKVRAPTEDDADALFTALYDPLPNKGQLSSWQVHVTNTGPITIDQIRLVFPADLNANFDLLVIPSQGALQPDGRTMQFDLNLPPGGQTVLYMALVPHVSGHFQIPVQVLLEKSGVQRVAANGGPLINADVTVS